MMVPPSPASPSSTSLFQFILAWAVQNIYVILLLGALATVAFFFLVAAGFVMLKWLQWEMDNSGVFFNKYSTATRLVLDKYKDWRIRRVMVVRQPFRRMLHWLLDVLTLFEYRKHYSEETKPFHTALMVEIAPPAALLRRQTRPPPTYLWIDKNNSVCVSERMHISTDFDYLLVPSYPPATKTKKRERAGAKNKKTKGETTETNKKAMETRTGSDWRDWTVSMWLEKTRDRVGDHAFFNWSLTQSNCQCFTKELLTTLGAYTPEMNDFVFRDQMIAKVAPSEFMLFIVHCVNHFFNAIEKIGELVTG